METQFETYSQIKKRHSDEIGSFSGLFWAFGNEQFKAGVEKVGASETNKVVSIKKQAFKGDNMQTWEEYDNQKKKERINFAFGLALIFLAVIIAFALLAVNAHADEMPSDYYIDNGKIVDAIYLIEGGTKAKKPFGILSVPCDSYQECRKVCSNTVSNNKKRYKEYGHKKYDSFLAFLQSRYAPLNVENDPQGLNGYWLKNIRSKLRGKT